MWPKQLSSILLSAFQYTVGYATRMTCEGSLENKGGKHKQGNDTADLRPVQPPPARLRAEKATPATMVLRRISSVMKDRFCPPWC